MDLQASTLKKDETGQPFHVQEAAQIRAFRNAWKEAGHAREPRVSRSIFALVDARDYAYFGQSAEGDQVGYLDETHRSTFGRNYAAAPDVLIKQLTHQSAGKATNLLT